MSCCDGMSHPVFKLNLRSAYVGLFGKIPRCTYGCVLITKDSRVGSNLVESGQVGINTTPPQAVVCATSNHSKPSTMIISTLLTAALTAVGAGAAAISNRDIAPGPHAFGYTPLGCIDYPSDDDGCTNRTMDACMVCKLYHSSRAHPPQVRIRGPPRISLTFTGRTAGDVGCCTNYRHNGPNISHWGSLPTTEDGWCATDKGKTFIKQHSDEFSYVGCYEHMWWYKAPYRADWGSFKPSSPNAKHIPEVAHNATRFPTFDLDYGPNIPLGGCMEHFMQVEYDNWPGIAMSPSGDCIGTNAQVGKTAPTKCTDKTWRFVFAGKPLPRAANTYGKH